MLLRTYVLFFLLRAYVRVCVRTQFQIYKIEMNIAWTNDALFLWRKRLRAVGKFLLNVWLFEGTDFKG